MQILLFLEIREYVSTVLLLKLFSPCNINFKFAAVTCNSLTVLLFLTYSKSERGVPKGDNLEPVV